MLALSSRVDGLLLLLLSRRRNRGARVRRRRRDLGGLLLGDLAEGRAEELQAALDDGDGAVEDVVGEDEDGGEGRLLGSVEEEGEERGELRGLGEGVAGILGGLEGLDRLNGALEVLGGGVGLELGD